MEQRSFNAFGAAGSDRMDRHLRLAIARNLARIYADVLQMPLPRRLQDLMARLEQRRG